MTTVTIESNQKPSEETLKRLSELRDEDIVYDDDCPELTPKMQKALACAVVERKRENPFAPKSAEDIYKDLEKSRECYERGEYEDFDEALDEISKKYNL